jgi:two-component system chemotaxis sensor kinase CheA
VLFRSPPANRQAAAAPPPPSALPLNGAESATVLAGEKILVVDDDMRNVYALVAAMEAKGMTALFAQNGREGLACLQTNPDIALVIMDIMMPEMDGYEAIRQIRKLPAFYNLPVIALTAKAMKQDREKCLAAGASDYISKPVQLDQLFSLLKVWLQK